MTRRRRTFAAVMIGVVCSLAAADVSSAAPPATTYTVTAGDGLVAISIKLKVNLDQLLKANHLSLNSVIWPGMKLVLPGAQGVPTTAPAPTTTAPKQVLQYTVQSGDSLLVLANRMKVAVKDLLAANKITLQSVIWPGMRLTVPTGGVLPAAPTPTTTAPKPPTTTTKPTAPSTTVPTTTAPTAGTTTTTVAVASRPPAPMVPVPPTDGLSAPVKAIIDFAVAQLGKPYKAYTAGPDSYDCSGLTMAAFAAARIRLPHQSGQQMQLGTVVDWTTEPVRAGDLVFLETSLGSGIVGHVGVATGPSTWIHSPRTGDVVRSSNIPFARVIGVRRYVQP
jgi:cell wall-associated NlpC family hydrolase